MRRFAILSLSAALLGTTPAAATQIHFLWESTGTGSISASPGQEVVLQAWVTVETPSIIAASVSALATPGILTAISYELCPVATGNLVAGSCASALGITLSPVGASQIVLNEQHGGTPAFETIPGLSGSFAAIAPPGAGPAEGSFVLAEITYLVTGAGFGEVLPYYRGGVDGVVEVDSTFLLPLADGADLSSGVTMLSAVVPEPATAGMLLLGLAGIAARQRGRRVRA